MTETPSVVEMQAAGLEAVKGALRCNRPKQRSMSWLSQELGLSRGATAHWNKVPEEYLRHVAALTGLHVSVIRPDLAEIFQVEAS